jgi:guanyl-specific ribonuclease Sa
MYNLTVEGAHTFFVGQHQWLVHNQCPLSAYQVADYVERNGGNPPPGYRGGTVFQNDGRGGGQRLSSLDVDGNRITYREYDVNPYAPGVNRGAERIVIGSDGSRYYTNDHYTTFTPF